MRLVASLLDWAIQSLLPHYKQLDFDFEFRENQEKRPPATLRPSSPMAAK